MKILKKVFPIILIILASCTGKTKDFTQPTVLEKGCMFDFSKITFQENVLELISKSLDTEDIEFNGSNYEVFKLADKYGQANLLDEDRYFFETKSLDSIAQFNGLYFYRVGIETNLEKNMVSIMGTAKIKVENKSELDSILSGLFKKLGKTTAELAIKADDEKRIQEMKDNGMSDEEIEFIGGNEGTKYNLLDYSDDGYFEWKLSDRYIQVSLSKDREICISTNSEENYNIEYYYIEVLIIKKEEYEKIASIQHNKSLELKQAYQIYKPYKLRALDPHDPNNWQLLNSLREAWDKK